CGMTSKIPITARLSARSQASQPAAIIRGPAMPAKRAFGSRRRKASISLLPRLSPEVSPATSTIKGPWALDSGLCPEEWRLISFFLTRAQQPRARLASSDDSHPLPPRRAVVQEIDEGLELGLRLQAACELLGRLDELHARAIQHAVRIADVADLIGREAASLQALRVDAVRLGRAADSHHERRHVARHRGVVRDEGMCADLAELVHAGEAAHVHPITDVNVAAQRRVV